MLKRWRLAIPAAVTAAAVLVGTPAHADPIRDQQQWVFNAMNVYPAWSQTQGAGVTVAVLDTGVDTSVHELNGIVTEGPDYTGLSTPESNSTWGKHGTMMSSLIAGRGTNSSSGVLGIAPQAKILAVRVIPDDGDPETGQFAAEQDPQKGLGEGIRYAADHGAQVISMSLGFGDDDSYVDAAVRYALSRGVILVASAGNDGKDDFSMSQGYSEDSYPAAYPGVLSVAAVDNTGQRASFSSDNITVQVAAPGVRVTTVGRGNTYWLVDGTSPAGALTAGVAALIRSKYPKLSPALVDQAITDTTSNKPANDWNDQVGFGEVNAGAALAEAGRLAGSTATVKTGPASYATNAAAVSPSLPSPNGAGIGGFGALCVVALGLFIAAFVVRRRRRAPLVLAGAGPLPMWGGPATGPQYGGPATGPQYGGPAGGPPSGPQPAVLPHGAPQQQGFPQGFRPGGPPGQPGPAGPPQGSPAQGMPQQGAPQYGGAPYGGSQYDGPQYGGPPPGSVPPGPPATGAPPIGIPAVGTPTGAGYYGGPHPPTAAFPPGPPPGGLMGPPPGAPGGPPAPTSTGYLPESSAVQEPSANGVPPAEEAPGGEEEAWHGGSSLDGVYLPDNSGGSWRQPR